MFIAKTSSGDPANSLDRLIFRIKKNLIYFLFFSALFGCREEYFFHEGPTVRLQTPYVGIRDRQVISSRDSCVIYLLTEQALTKEGIFPKAVPETLAYMPHLQAFDRLGVHPGNRCVYLFQKRANAVLKFLPDGRFQPLKRDEYSPDSAQLGLRIERWNRPIFYDASILIPIYRKGYMLEQHYSYPIIGKFDTTLILRNQFIRYPNTYSSTNYWHVVGDEYSQLPYGKDKLLYSFPMNDTLFLFDKNGQLVKQKRAASRYLSPFPPPCYQDSLDKNQAGLVEFVSTLSRYGMLLYDPYRKFYYRVAIHSQPAYQENGRKNTNRDNPWSLIILDVNLNVIGEQLFEKSRYVYDDLAVCKEGILVRNNYYFIKENRSQFDYTLFLTDVSK